MAKDVVIFSDATGQHDRKREPIVANHWRGEQDCVVGPFSSKKVADYFGEAVVNFNRPARIFARRDAWYVEVLGNADEADISRGGDYALSDR